MEKIKLTNENIDFLSDKIEEIYSKAECNKKDTLRAKFMMESALLKYQMAFGDDIDIKYNIFKVFGQIRFVLRVPGDSFNPFEKDDNPMSFMVNAIMQNFESNLPTWKYKNMENEIVFSIRKKQHVGNLARIFISLLISLILGFGSRLIFGSEAFSGFVTNYIDPITDAYAGVFCVMAVFLTFFAISLSIIHIGDMKAVGTIGGHIMKCYLGVSAGIAIVATLLLLPFFTITEGANASISAKSIYDIFVGFIPTNAVRPFIDFNSVHIMIIGAMFGFSLLAMGEKGSALCEIFEECNLVAVFTNDFLNKFIFIYVALKIFGITTTFNFSDLASAGKMVAVIIGFNILLMVLYSAYSCFRTKMPIKKFVKTLMPPFLVCLSSANFGAAFNTIFDSVVAGGVDTDTAGVTINLGSVFFQPASTITLIVSALFMANAYGVEISWIWILVCVVLAIVLVGTMPNIPGALITVVSLLFAQLGLPSEALAITIAVMAIVQFLTVAVDVWCLESEIFSINKSFKKKGIK